MRILSVNTALGAAVGGGTGERTLQLARVWKRAGADCAVLTLDLGEVSSAQEVLEGVPVTALHCVLPRYYAFRLPEHRILERVKWADVVHLMNHWTLLNACVYRAARQAGRPYVICPAGALEVYGRSTLAKHLYTRLVGRRIIRNASACVAIAENEIGAFRRYGVPDDRIKLIPNGVDPGEFRGADPNAFRRRFGLRQADFILFMGRLNYIKGPDMLLRAFIALCREFGSLHLVFAGPDEGLAGSLRSMAREADVHSRVHFLGSISGTDRAGAYAASCLLAIPSRQEAMSLVALEAGICATPVLLTDQCGFNEIQTIGGGKVVNASPDSLQSGLREMLTGGSLREMGGRLKDHVRRNYLWTAAAQKYMQLFERIAADGRHAENVGGRWRSHTSGS